MTSVISPLWLSSYPPKLTSLVSWGTTTSVCFTIEMGVDKKSLITQFVVLTEQVAGGIIVPGSGRLVALLGVDDIIVVDMPDTLMVTTRARSQEVKRLVKKCREQGWKKLL